MANLIGTSTDQNTPAVDGSNNNHGIGVRGTCNEGTGVIGTSETGLGIWGISKSATGVGGVSESGVGVHGNSKSHCGIVGVSDEFDAVQGISHSPTGTAVLGVNDNTGRGVVGVAQSATAVEGNSKSGTGVWGSSETGRGVVGIANQATAVEGNSMSGFGVFGKSKNNSGVLGTSENGQGLTAYSDNNIGIFARGATFSGVFEGALVVSKGPSPRDASIPPSDINGSIVINDGNLFVNNGDVILHGADCAEEFDVAGVENVEAGTVMVINENGTLKISDQPYDKRVAGVVSGAGDYKPGLILDRQQIQHKRKPIALIGKVYCKVDAQYGAIEVGDLITTSPTPGYAMKAADPFKAFGTVIGKALAPIRTAKGLIPILVTLQ